MTDRLAGQPTQQDYVNAVAKAVTVKAETPRQEIRRLRWIVRHVEKLSPAGLRWLRDVLNERLG